MASTQPSPALGGSITSGPFSLPYRVEGSGHPTIVIGSSVFYPRAFSDRLREHLRFVFMDHRGFAPSPGPVAQSEFELDKVLDDVELLRQHLGLGPIAVIGHSGHALMALEYAKRYPEHTSHVIMIGIAPDLSEASATLAEENWQALADDDRRAAERENMQSITDEELADLAPGEGFVRGYVRNAARVWYDPRFDCSPLWEGVTPNMDMIGYVWGETFAEIDVTEGLKSLDRPVFMALGRYDFIVAPPSSWDPLRDKFQDLTLRIFEQSGHTPQFEEAAQFDDALLAWIKSRSQ